MPVFEFTSPEGKTYEVEGPEGSTKEQAFQILQQQLSGQPEQPEQRKQDITLPQALFGNQSISDYLHGRVEAGKEVLTPEYWKGLAEEFTRPQRSDIGQLAKQLSQPAEISNEQRDQILGMVMSVGPTSAMSSAIRQSVLGPAAQGVQGRTLREAGELGFKVPRSYAKPGAVSNIGERFAGKQATEAAAAAKNTEAMNSVARRALGLKEGADITPQVLSGIRKTAGKAYEQVKGIGNISSDKAYQSALQKIEGRYSGAAKDFPELARKNIGEFVKGLDKKTISSEGAVEMVKKLRFDGNKAIKALDPEANILGMAKLDAAKAIDDLLARNAQKTLKPEAFKAYIEARQLIAKTHTIENALNEATGNVSARELAKALRRGVPLTGELRKAALFAGAVKPTIAGEAFGTPAAGGMFEPLSYSVAGGLSGHGGVALGGLPIIGKPLARSLMVVNPASPVKPSIFEPYLRQRLIAGTGGSNQ